MGSTVYDHLRANSAREHIRQGRGFDRKRRKFTGKDKTWKGSEVQSASNK